MRFINKSLSADHMKINYNKNSSFKKNQFKIMLRKNINYKISNYYSIFFKKLNNIILSRKSMLENYIDIQDFIMGNNFFFCFGEIDEVLINMIINNFIYSSLNNNLCNSYKILINSPGGDIIAGFALYDILSLGGYKINTIGLGITASMAAFLLASGEKRTTFPNTRIMIHQPLGGIQGTIAEIEIQAKELIFYKNNLNYLLSKLTNQSISKIEKDTARDRLSIFYIRYLTPLEAIEYGLIDNIISSHKEVSFRKIAYFNFSKSSVINWNEINNFM
uniref:ATP-dependent Clp protease proteolytic subunit n=1 Tax=Lotharella vacuolata TaxID=74820 RepID=A0A0H5BQW5_9EUKA|nr:clp protease [Lotharella vacuolata]